MLLASRTRASARRMFRRLTRKPRTVSESPNLLPTLIKVFAGFAAVTLISPLALGAMVGIYALEALVAVVQAYVFTILTCVYLKDAVGDAHH